MDFALRLTFLPAMSGNERVEEMLCDEIERATGEKPVGVSLTWETAMMREDLMKTIDDQIDELHEEHHKRDMSSGRKVSVVNNTGISSSNHRLMLLTPRSGQLVDNQSSRLRQCLLWVESIVLSQLARHIANHGRPRDRRHGTGTGSGSMRRLRSGSTKNLSVGSRIFGEDSVEQELRMMHSCNTAFAVFNTQQSRDRVYEICKRAGGFCFRGKAVKVNKSFDAPDSVNWTNFHDTHWLWMTGRCVMGVMMVIAALLAWMMVFYVPYAIFFLKFNY